MYEIGSTKRKIGHCEGLVKVRVGSGRRGRKRYG
jgi:hypothetical protein